MGYRKREGYPSRFGSRTGHESSPFIRLLSVGSIEIETSLGQFSMTLVMTMSVEDLAIAKGVWPSPTFGNDVVDFPDVSIFKDESTVTALPLLIFEKPGEFALHEGVPFESLTPREKLAVRGACSAWHLAMVGDGGLAVLSKDNALRGHEDPVALSFCPPVGLCKPFLSPGRMFVPGPLGELQVHNMIASAEGFLGGHRPIGVRPPTSERVQFLACLLTDDAQGGRNQKSSSGEVAPRWFARAFSAFILGMI